MKWLEQKINKFACRPGNKHYINAFLLNNFHALQHVLLLNFMHSLTESQHKLFVKFFQFIRPLILLIIIKSY
jgi:hypothetical protein